MHPYNLQSFIGSLVGFLGEQVQVKGYITLKIVFGLKESTKMIKVKYIIANILSSHTIIIRKSSFNIIEAYLSILYLTVKYLLKNE